jgi:Protein of unknown function (DUF4242)
MARSRLPVFLLDSRVGPVAETDLARIHQVLLHAVARLVADGASIRYTHGLFIPDEGQCVCLLEAADVASVVRAGDIAGFPLARVRPAIDLTSLSQPVARPLFPQG